MFDFFFPQTLEKISSEFNGEIKIVKQFGHVSVWVEGFEQSGPIVEKLWTKALNQYSWKPLTIREICILGLGCGVVAKLLSDKFPKAHLTGIEIDDKMIAIGKKYFDLGSIPNLEIICTQARNFLDSNTKNFDLILVDLYKGGVASDILTSNTFIQKISQILTLQGTAIFNSLTFEKSKEIKSDLLRILLVHFKTVKPIKTEYNYLMCCSNSDLMSFSCCF